MSPLRCTPRAEGVAIVPMGKMMVEPPWACLVLDYPRNVNTEGDHQQGLAVPVSHEYNTDGK